MREDFSDIIHERARVGARNLRSPKGEKKNAQRAFKDGMEHLLVHEGNLRKKWGWDKRENRHSGPIKQFLRSRVGRKWDDVYSEIAAVCDLRSGPQRSVYDLIEVRVTTDVVMIDDEPHDSKGMPIGGYGDWQDFYVDPKDGTLKIAENRRYRYMRQRRSVEDYVVIDDLHQYRLIDGIWYLITFEKYGAHRSGQWVKPIAIGIYDDILLQAAAKKKKSNVIPGHLSGRSLFIDSWRHEFLVRLYGAPLVAVAKKQANKKEIRHIKQELFRSRMVG